jgi:hypothetical protein
MAEVNGVFFQILIPKFLKTEQPRVRVPPMEKDTGIPQERVACNRSIAHFAHQVDRSRLLTHAYLEALPGR